MNVETRYKFGDIVSNYFRDFVLSTKFDADNKTVTVKLASGRTVKIDIGDSNGITDEVPRVAGGPAANA